MLKLESQLKWAPNPVKNLVYHNNLQSVSHPRSLLTLFNLESNFNIGIMFGSAVNKSSVHKRSDYKRFRNRKRNYLDFS